jgi:hypothetical protein
MTAPATQERMQALWHALLNAHHRYLRDTPPEKKSAAMMEEGRKFLRDNNIRADLSSLSDAVEHAAQLRDVVVPFPPSDKRL